MSSFLQGALLGASLIIAIGAQNAFVLAQALRGNHPMLVALLCSAVDATLVVIGIWGLGQFIEARPSLLGAITLGGAMFLLSYAVLAFRRAARPRALQADALPPDPDSADGRTRRHQSARRVVLATLAISLLNPHVYLDTVLLLGSLGGRLPGQGPIWFGLGAITASFVWFFSLALGGRSLAPYLATPRHWQRLDCLIGCIMALIGLGLLRRYLTL